MIRSLFVFLLILLANICFAQNEGNIWYFGFNAGLDFNSGVPVALTDGQLYSDEACATISNNDGELLFYSDGITVWNKNHAIMPNGTDLNGHSSTSQGVTIIQKPGSNTIYYVFTIDVQLGSKGFCYSEVDISLSNGLGAVTSKNILIKSNITEKLAICPHSNGLDYWVVVHGVSNEYFLSYLVTASGISSTPISSNIGSTIPAVGEYTKGVMKFSNNGTKAATSSSIYFNQAIELFDFDKTTGILSNLKTLIVGTESSENYYGIEFSPDGNLLYCSNVSSNLILQFDLNAVNIPASAFIHPINDGLGSSYGNGSLQLGPDGKIYISSADKLNLSVINYPNIYGVGCNLESNAINLNGKISYLGLPNCYSVNEINISSISTTPLCSGVDFNFNFSTALPIDSVIWDFGDSNTSTILNPTHSYLSSGTYIVNLTLVSNSNSFTKKTLVDVILPTIAFPTASSPQVFCKQENVTLTEIIVTGQDIKWYDALTNGTLLPNTTLLVNGTTYYVSQTINGCESARIAVVATVYETAAPTGMAVQTFCDTQVLTLADFVVSGTDLLFYDGSVGGNLLPMTTTLVDGVTYYASQTLNGCESVSRLTLTPDIISGVPANDFSELMCDDLDNGIEAVDLSDYNGNLIANASAYTFKYYTTYSAAENEGVSISNFSNYDLHTGLNTIYVRVEFANSCYEVVALELTVVALPKLNMKDTYAVCENGFVTITADAGFDNYSWSTGETSQSIVVTNGGNYWVTVTKNTNGLICSSTKNITVEVSQKATITAVETVDWTSNDNVITVYVDGSGVYEYSVDGINFQSSNQFFGLPNGEYTVYVNDTKGCGVAKKDVYLLMYPKYFTPNGDSYNDFWGIQFYQNEMNLVVKIFDRYGKFIKQLNSKDPIWDGTYEGNNLPATDYWFTVIREDGTEYNGHFTLKR